MYVITWCVRDCMFVSLCTRVCYSVWGVVCGIVGWRWLLLVVVVVVVGVVVVVVVVDGGGGVAENVIKIKSVKYS